MINKLLKELISEMWNVKDSKSVVDTKHLIEFSEQYFNALNLVLDLINSNVIRDKENHLIPNPNEEIIIEFFKRVNQNKYNRLIVDTLIELDSQKSINYLKEIISVDDNFISFKEDFEHYPDYEKISTSLKQLNLQSNG